MEDMGKQAKKKALRILEQMDRTESELCLKLKQKGYSEKDTEQAVAYVKSFGYLDDVRYAERFVINKQRTKSKQEIYALLSQKGVARDVIQEAIEKGYIGYSEIETIQHLFHKKGLSVEKSGAEEKQKFYGYLLRRGFHSEDIRQVLQVSFRNA